MAKYSTGSGSSQGGGDTCELCGATSDNLRTANIAGAQLEVCQSCRPHDDTAHRDAKKSEQTPDRESPDRKKQLARRIARAQDAAKPDTSRWEREGAGYDDDPLPYLIAGYGSTVTEARQAAGLQLEELAEEVDVREADLLAIEQGRATQAGIGGSVITRIEERLDVTLSENA